MTCGVAQRGRVATGSRMNNSSVPLLPTSLREGGAQRLRPNTNGWFGVCRAGAGFGPRAEAGLTYVAVLFFIAASGAALAATAMVWSHERQREKEQELLWVGNKFREAIGLYYQRSPGTVKRYPEKLEDLLEDRRYLSLERYLQKVYRDPITGKSKWGLVPAPGGGIMGVHSLSERSPIKTGEFSYANRGLTGSTRYSDWRFVYESPALSAETGKPLGRLGRRGEADSEPGQGLDCFWVRPSRRDADNTCPVIQGATSVPLTHHIHPISSTYSSRTL